MGQLVDAGDVASAQGDLGHKTRNACDGRADFRRQLIFGMKLCTQVFKNIVDGTGFLSGFVTVFRSHG